MARRQTTEMDRLMVDAGAGDEAAFRRFYDLAAPAILAFLTRMLPDRFHAEDVLQDAMVIAWNRADEFDPNIAAAKTWITTIARRRALDVLRSRGRQQEVLRDDAANIRATLNLDEAIPEPSPESDATEQRLTFCLGELSPEAASCIRLAYLDGLTFSEIAGRIDRSLNSVKSWIRRGLGKLKQCMQP